MRDSRLTMDIWLLNTIMFVALRSRELGPAVVTTVCRTEVTPPVLGYSDAGQSRTMLLV